MPFLLALLVHGAAQVTHEGAASLFGGRTRSAPAKAGAERSLLSLTDVASEQESASQSSALVGWHPE